MNEMEKIQTIITMANEIIQDSVDLSLLDYVKFQFAAEDMAAACGITAQTMVNAIFSAADRQRRRKQ